MKDILLVLVFMLASVTCVYAQKGLTANNSEGLKIVKYTHSGQRAEFKLDDAIALVTYFMNKESVVSCESDVTQQSLSLVVVKGVNPLELLRNSAIQQELSNLGFEVEGLPEAEPTILDQDTNTSEIINECDDCGEVELSQEAINEVANPDAYEGSSILIDFGDNNGGGIDADNNTDFNVPSGTTPEYTPEQLDSIRNALFSNPDGE